MLIYKQDMKLHDAFGPCKEDPGSRASCSFYTPLKNGKTPGHERENDNCSGSTMYAVELGLCVGKIQPRKIK